VVLFEPVEDFTDAFIPFYLGIYDENVVFVVTVFGKAYTDFP